MQQAFDGDLTAATTRGPRRARLRAQPTPAEWAPILADNVPVYRRVPEELRVQLHAHMRVFLAEKHFEGCDGLVMTDEVRVTIACQACLLLLNRELRESRYYPGLVTVLVYPSVFFADVEEVLGLKALGVIPESSDVLNASNKGEPVILESESEAGQAYDDAVARLLGEDRPLRFTTLEKKGFFSKLFGG